MVHTLTTNNTDYAYVDILGNELHVGDYVACAVNYGGMEIHKVLGFRANRILIPYGHRHTSIHPSQCVKLQPEDVTLYYLTKKNET